MKVTISNEYFDKKLGKKVKAGAIRDLDDDRIEELMEVGIDVEEYVEESDKDGLIKAYENDRSIVDDLKADDLKVLCEHLDIRYTKADEIREHLKNLEPLEE